MQDINTLRRDKLMAIISRAHSRLQAVLVDAGIDPAVARVVAATRVYHLLPPTIRQQLATLETEVATRMVTLFRDVARSGEEELKAVPIE